MKRLFSYALLSLNLFVWQYPAFSSLYNTENAGDLQNTNYSTPVKIKPSEDSYYSPRDYRIQGVDQIYALEEQLIDQFEEYREEFEKETRETLGSCFEKLMNLPLFKENYYSVEDRGHIFFVPKCFQIIEDTNQLVRMVDGKAFTSPVKGHAFQGHHIQMRNPLPGQPAYIWVITRTNHLKAHKALHIHVGKSAVSRNQFRSSQQRAYKLLGIANLMKLDKTPKHVKLSKKRHRIKQNPIRALQFIN